MAISPKDASREFQRAVRAHRSTLDRLLDRRALFSLRRYYDQAQDRLESQLGRMAKESKHSSLTPLQAQQLLLQVKQAQQEVAQRMARMLTPALEEAQTEGVLQTDKTMDELEREFTGGALLLGLDEPSTVSRLIEKRSPALNAINATSWAAFGAAAGTSAAAALSVSLALEETPREAVSRMRSGAEGEWWKAERIVRTEMAQAYNGAQADAIEDVAGAVPGLGKRWCELVDDVTGMPLDERVGNDSLVLHGQIVEYAGRFVMPPDPTVSPVFWNQSWFASPNRPNDRSVTMPWRRQWGVPGWVWRNGERVPVVSGSVTE